MKNNNTEETAQLRYVCTKCKKESYPLGYNSYILPYTSPIRCPHCNHFEEKVDWLDSDTRKKLVEKQYIGDVNDKKIKVEIIQNKIESLEARADADRKEIQNLRQIIDLLIQKEIKDLKDKASDHDFNLNTLQDQITKLQNTFDKIRQFQEKQDGQPSPKT